MSDRITRVFNEPPYDPDRDQEAKAETGRMPRAGGDGRNTRGIIVITAIVILSLIVLFAVIPQIILCFDPYSPVLTGSQRVNIQTGQLRTVKYVYFIKIRDEIEDTIISGTLKNKRYVFKKSEPWRTTHARCYSYLNRVRSTYRFRMAAYSHQKIQLLFEIMKDEGKPLPQKTKEDICRNVLKLWQEGKSGSNADNYINKLWEEYYNILEE